MSALPPKPESSRRPRPWFLSLSAIWTDDVQGHGLLATALKAMGFPATFPYHQIELPAESRHSTMFAILRVNALPTSGEPLRDFARGLLSRLSEDVRILEGLTQLLQAGLDLEAYEVRVFDSGTAVQFHGGPPLAAFRAGVANLLAEPVAALVTRHPDGLLDSLVRDPNKSVGERAFGSLSRSPSREDAPAERWRTFIEPPVKLRFRRLHLLTSDEALTNPRAVGVEDIPVGD